MMSLILLSSIYSALQYAYAHSIIAGTGQRETVCAAATTEETVFPMVSLSCSQVLKTLIMCHILQFCELCIFTYRPMASECDTVYRQIDLHADVIDP